MINKNQAAEIRTCERIKFDQALYILTMYQKKIRIPLQQSFSQEQSPKPIDAQQQYEQTIIRSWNKKWKKDLTKPVLNCVTSVYPRVLYDAKSYSKCNPHADKYNQAMEMFIKRLRAEHEDESNYKIVETNIDDLQIPDHRKGRGHLMETIMNFVTTIKTMTQGMLSSIQLKQEQLQNIDDPYPYSTATILQGIQSIVNKFESQLENNDQLFHFTYSVMKILQDIKQSEYGSTMIAVQPNVKQFTFILHPLLLPLYGNLLKQKQQAKRKMENKQQNMGNSKKLQQTEEYDNRPFKQFFISSTSSLSKTVFINLDGYESEYNLQFMRCFRKNIMYVSFPKEDIHSKNDDNTIYEKRFFKKLMYNYEKNNIKGYERASSSHNEGMQEQSMQDQLERQINQKYLLVNNAQDYYKNVQKQLYEFQRGYEDLNKNMYIFPLRLNSLQENFNNLRQQSEEVLQFYQSNIILQIFRNYLINQIQQFIPTQIIVSYSQRLRIQDKHFVQIIQQLTKLSHYKVILFPNITAAFANSDIISHDINSRGINFMNHVIKKSQTLTQKLNDCQMQSQHYGQQMQSQKISNTPNSGISRQTIKGQMHLMINNKEETVERLKISEQISYTFFNKIARFLKVASGTYSLMKQFEEEGTLAKFKNLYALQKFNRLLQVLGLEYQNIERIRFKSKQIQMISKLYEQDYNKVVKIFTKLVPRYYFDLYDVIQAMITITLVPQDHSNYDLSLKLLRQFNISQQGVMDNIQIHQIIQYIQDKVVIRDVINEKLRNQMVHDRIIKNLRMEKQKHFLQISEQKYEQSTLFYFRMMKTSQIYDQCQENKVNLRGLIQISFANPNKQSKQPLYIYQTSQIHYKIDQRVDTGAIPILIMNHLPCDKKYTPKFNNYCAFIDRNTVNKLLSFSVDNNMKNNGNQTGKQNLMNAHNIQKIPEIRKQKKVFPIKLHNLQGEQIIEHRFEFRTEWNYIETDDYMMLYWPMLFNMVEAACLKIQGRIYQAPLLNQIFISDKQVQNGCVKFYQAYTPEDIVPRSTCTAYSFNNQVYIFGGFYEKSKNYLYLNRDITRCNLELYQHTNHRKIQVVNEKTNLYPASTSDQTKPEYQQPHDQHCNSYVRARQQYQFYDIEQLSEVDHLNQFNQLDNNTIKTVIMMGGYGQNYLHPYSMLTYYYYILKFRRDNGLLLSIDKKLIYNKSVPINISMRNCSKNMGIIKSNIRSRGQGTNQKKISTQMQLTQPDSYGRFRAVYKIDNQNGGQFLYKFQFMFSEKDIKMYKQDLRKITDEKLEVNDMNGTRMQKIQGINNKLIVQKYGSKEIVHLRLQLPNKMNNSDGFISLTNQSVKYLSIINSSYICAIVKHPFYTNGRSMVVECRQRAIDNKNQEQTSYMNLKPISDDLIKGDLSLHILQASNINLVYVLHGHRIFQSDQIHEYHITNNRRDGSKSISQIRPKKQMFSIQEQKSIRCCYSVFFYRKQNRVNQIVCQNYIGTEDSNTVYRILQKFQPMDSTNLRWQQTDKPISYIFCIKSWSNPTRLDRMSFLQFLKQNESRRTIIVSYNKRKYKICMGNAKYQRVLQSGQIAIMLEQVTEQQIRRLDEQEGQKGTILQKKPDYYIDRGYVNA